MNTPEQNRALPSGHPSIPASNIGVLLLNLGTPDATDYWSMRRYLNEFLSDRRVIDYPAWKWQPLLQLIILTKRPFSSGEAYRSIWNNEKDESPLLTISRDQAEKLADALQSAYPDQIICDFAMRYGNPSTRSRLARLQEQGCDRIVVFPLYPQYSAPTTATANDQVFRCLMEMTWQPAVRTVPAYFDHDKYIAALAASVRDTFQKIETPPEKLVLSYHGMPQRYLEQGDPYHCHCQKTSRLLNAALDLPETELITTFQSRFGKEEWLQPYTVEEVARLAKNGTKSIAVMAPAFSSDCVETLEEIQEEIRDAFLEAGGETFTYIPCLNASDDHIAMMMAILQTELAGWVT